MKNIFIILCLVFSLKSHAQSVKSTRITQPEAVNLITSIESMEMLKGDQLHLKIFKRANGSGSANTPETHETSYNLLISVAHYDENPERRLFSIGPFIQPKVIKKLDSGKSVTLLIEDGDAKDKKTYRVMISETEVRIQQ